MLAALLANLPPAGQGTAGGVDEEKAQVALEALREDYLARQREQIRADLDAAKVVDAPAEPSPTRIVVPPIAAVGGVAENDDDLALLLILAEI